MAISFVRRQIEQLIEGGDISETHVTTINRMLLSVEKGFAQAIVTGCVKTRKYGALPTSIFSVLPKRNNIAMHKDYVTKHIVCE
jgi:hypothetical protein